MSTLSVGSITGISSISANDYTFSNSISVGNSSVNSTINATAMKVGGNTLTVGTGTYFVSNGNVGIGNTSPSYKLDVTGNIRGYISGGGDQVVAESNTGQAIMRATNDSGGLYIGVESANGYAFGLAGNTRIIYSNGNYPLQLFTNGTAKMAIAANGNIGIGNTNSTYQLTVQGSDTVLNLRTSLDNGRTTLLFTGNNILWEIGTRSNNSATYAKSFYMYDAIALQYRALIDANGCFSIGNTAYIGGIGTAAEKLHVAGNIIINNANFLKTYNPAGASFEMLGCSSDGGIRFYSANSTAPLYINPDRAASQTIINTNNGGAVRIGDGVTSTDLTVSKGNVILGGNVSVYGTGLYSNNLLLQGDGTNAYIRPVNSGSILYLGANNNNHVSVTPGGNLETRPGMASPIFFINRTNGYDDITPGNYLNLKELGGGGGYESWWHWGIKYPRTNASDSPIAWESFRLIFRMCGSGVDVSPIPDYNLRVASYFYAVGWYQIGSQFTVNIDGARGYVTVVSPWISLSSSDITNWGDVDGLGLYHVSSTGNRTVRIGPTYIQYKY